MMVDNCDSCLPPRRENPRGVHGTPAATNSRRTRPAASPAAEFGAEWAKWEGSRFGLVFRGGGAVENRDSSECAQGTQTLFCARARLGILVIGTLNGSSRREEPRFERTGRKLPDFSFRALSVGNGGYQDVGNRILGSP